MFKKTLVTMLLVAAVQVNAAPLSPLAYNDKIVQEINVTLKDVEQAMASIPHAKPKDQAEAEKMVKTAKNKLDIAIKSIDKHLAVIQKLEYPKGGEQLQAAVIEKFTLESNFLKTEVAEVFNINTKKPDQEKLQADIKRMMDKVPELEKNDQKFQQVQQAFANANGIKLKK